MNIGIDIGGNHVGVGLVDSDGNILLKKEEDVVSIKNEGKHEEVLVDIIVKFVNEILEEESISINEIGKIGIASPGSVINGIISAGNLGIKNFNIKEEIGKHYNIPITVRNDAKCAGIAENRYGALKDYNNSIFLTIGTGIGGAIFINGELLKPVKYEGAEVGHMIIEKNGTECKCGKKGCFEKYAAISALKNMVIEAFNINEELTGLELYTFIKTKMQNEKMQKVIDEYVENLVIGISNLINIFEPEVVCLGGSFAYYEDILLDKIIETLPPYCFNKEIPNVIVALTKNDAGIIGAAI